MSTVINDLEVVATPDPSRPATATTRAPEPPPPTPFELRALLRHVADRADRSRAD